MKGFWETENTFVIHFNELADINNWRITMTFEGDKIALLMQEPTWVGDATFDGILDLYS